MSSISPEFFPDPHLSPGDSPIAYGGELSAELLIKAYKKGIFPWFNDDDPILWWCPDPRFILFPEELKVSNSLKREMANNWWRVSFDCEFEKVINECANAERPGQSGTWINSEMISSYIALHRMGLAHSVECWENNNLVGGLYGVSLGNAFFGESMFFHKPNASKITFICLIKKILTWKFQIVDCQVPTKHLASFGAREIPRCTFIDLLNKALKAKTVKGNWGSF